MKSWDKNNMLREEYDFNPRSSEEAKKFFQGKMTEIDGLLQDLLHSECLWDNERAYLEEVEDAIWDMRVYHDRGKE
jgi:hypothetical protein